MERVGFEKRNLLWLQKEERAEVVERTCRTCKFGQEVGQPECLACNSDTYPRWVEAPNESWRGKISDLEAENKKLKEKIEVLKLALLDVSELCLIARGCMPDEDKVQGFSDVAINDACKAWREMK